jgi:branched-chain amino acid transport system ATP-binding protein
MELVLEHVSKSFGGLRAVGDVSFAVQSKTIFGLIGPNGAGKTTVFNLITGVYKPDAGSVRFGTTDLRPLRPAQIAGVGIGRTFQNIRLFGQLTVIENLLVACELQKKAHLASAVFRLPVHYEDEATMNDRALELLRVFDLQDMADDAPTSLSYGNQRRLEIARAMMLAPKVLLLDEPAAGMNYGEAEGLKTQIRWLRDTFDIAVVLVEHNMQVVMGVCEELHVLDHGETIAHGTPEEIRKHPKVLAAYLGEEEEAPEVLAAVESASTPELLAVAASSEPAASKPEASVRPSRPAEKLTEPELADLSRELTRSLERGLSKLPAAPHAKDAEKELANVGAVEVLTEADRPTPPATAAVEPSERKLDSDWGSERDVGKRDAGSGSGAATGAPKQTNGVHAPESKKGKE